MKKKIVFVCALVLMLSTRVYGQTVQLVSSETIVSNDKLKWATMEHNFGDLKKGIPVSVTFEFINTGKSDVLLTNVKGSCGCTTTDYSQEPIKPGKKGKITATYNAATTGDFVKTVTVMTQDTDNPIVLTIKGTVKN